jgi:hypothetical protein
MIHSFIIQKNLLKQLTPMLFSLGLLLFVSCQDTLSVDPKEDFIIFGQFNGYCFGDACYTFYALTEDDLLESNVHEYSGDGIYPSDDYSPLSEDKFNLIRDLGDFVPQELWLETTTHIGQADLSDVGALYFEIKNGSDHRYWVFENGDFDMPLVYKSFMAKIQEKIILLQ